VNVVEINMQNEYILTIPTLSTHLNLQLALVSLYVSQLTVVGWVEHRKVQMFGSDVDT